MSARETSCSHCGFVARQLEYDFQARFASVSHQSLGTTPRVSFNMRTHGWVFRRSLTPGGDEPAIHTSETFNRCLDDCILYTPQRPEVSVEAVKGLRAVVSAVVARTWRCLRRCITGMSLASRRAWATRAVASEDISSPANARSKPDVSPPIVRCARAGDCNVLSFLAFLGQVSSPAQCPRAPHA